MDAYDLCRAAGSQLPEAQLRRLTRIKPAFVQHLNPGRFLPAYLTDAKAFHDRDPGILRDWGLLSSPLALLISDVTPLDIRFVLPDGREVKLRLIASVDGKTRRLFGHIYVPAKGQGVRQEHVAAHIVWICLEHGIPDDWMIDHGGEMAIDDMVGTLMRVHKSLPYNARAKLIESIFSVLLRFIAEIPGFIGSDRMRKKTQSVGKPAQPFKGTIEDLIRAIQQAIAHYNATPQDALDGAIPDEAWQSAISAGWRPRKADQATLAETFCRRIVRTVTRGAVKIDNLSFTAEELWRRADLEGEKVTVAVSLFGFPPAVFDRSGTFVCLLQEDQAYHPLNPAGAVESARRKRIRSQGARELLAAHPPADLGDYRRRFLAQHAPVIEPAAGALIALPGERGKAVEARRQAGVLPAPEPAAENPRVARRRRLAGLPPLAAAND